MHFSTLATTLLLAGSAVAAPGTAMRKARALARKSSPNQRVGAPFELVGEANKTNVQVCLLRIHYVQHADNPNSTVATGLARS